VTSSQDFQAYTIDIIAKKVFDKAKDIKLSDIGLSLAHVEGFMNKNYNKSSAREVQPNNGTQPKKSVSFGFNTIKKPSSSPPNTTVPRPGSLPPPVSTTTITELQRRASLQSETSPSVSPSSSAKITPIGEAGLLEFLLEVLFVLL
jgi:hypothetical protein